MTDVTLMPPGWDEGKFVFKVRFFSGHRANTCERAQEGHHLSGPTETVTVIASTMMMVFFMHDTHQSGDSITLK